MELGELQQIRDEIEVFKKTESPDGVATCKANLAIWKERIGSAWVDEEIAYQIRISELLKADSDLTVNRAEALVKAEPVYKTYRTTAQLYKDLATIISACNSKLNLLENQWRQR